MTPLAHIAGIPVEETLLSFGPVLLAGGGIIAVKVRSWLGRDGERQTEGQRPESDPPAATPRHPAAPHRAAIPAQPTAAGPVPPAPPSAQR